MKHCVACDRQKNHFNDERLFDAVRRWLWEDAPYLVKAFPAMKYSALNQESGRTLLCRSCLLGHVADWLDTLDAPLGVKQQFRRYFATRPVHITPIQSDKRKKKSSEDYEEFSQALFPPERL